MVRVTGNTKLSSVEKRELAESYGVKFIKLKHIDGFGNTDKAAIGFQNVTIVVRETGNGRRFVDTVYSKNRLGNDCSSGSLRFVPDKMGELIAYLPDTSFNRNKLASALYAGNSPYRIVDPEIDAEIDKLANKMKRDPVVQKREKEIQEAREAEARRHEEEARRGDSKAVREHRSETAGLKELAETVKTLAKVQIDQLEKKAEVKGTNPS